MKTFYIILCIFFLQACKQKTPKNARFVHYTPKLEKAFQAASEAENIRSFLVSHNDRLIAEAYYKSYSSDSLDHVRSVTKSVMSTLIGIAIDKKMIPTVDQSISDYFPIAAKGKEEIKIKHLLNMTSGLKWSEGNGYNDNDEMKASSSQYKYVLAKTKVHKAGSVWNYSTGGTHLLSLILTKATGMSTLDFANKHLFKPIGINSVDWIKYRGGYYGGGSGLQLKPRDMIKLGQLYAKSGIIGKQQIISGDYIDEATKQQEPPGTAPNPDEGYGYCWWVTKHKDLKTFMALGYGGQVIIVTPKLNLVTVVTHNWRVNGNQAGRQQRMAHSKIGRLVFEAIYQ